MTKWEYCILREHTPTEYWIYNSKGEKEKVKDIHVSLAAVLARLGAEGWEAVNFDNRWKDSLSTGSFNVWPGTTDGREILFKRPIE
jgi:hypothetical protein